MNNSRRVCRPGTAGQASSSSMHINKDTLIRRDLTSHCPQFDNALYLYLPDVRPYPEITGASTAVRHVSGRRRPGNPAQPHAICA